MYFITVLVLALLSLALRQNRD